MEIERKFLIKDLPKDLTSYPCSQIEQAYLNENPVLRIRRKDDDYILTYKSKGMMAREESEFPLTKEAYEHLRTKADGKIISKTRYFIPLAPHTIELDVFHGGGGICLHRGSQCLPATGLVRSGCHHGSPLS